MLRRKVLTAALVSRKQMVDYSKWDKFCCSDDEGDGDDYEEQEQVRTSPVVTRLGENPLLSFIYHK